MKRSTAALLLIMLLSMSRAHASQVITDSITSVHLGITVPYTVALPDSYAVKSARGVKFPVLYLLHCAGCIHRTWLASDDGNLASFIDSVSFIAACPSDGSSVIPGRRYSWWLDSPVLPSGYASSRFLTEEFKPRIDSLFATIVDRANTGIAGFSMGGFGALHNQIRHPDLFGAAFSIKGGVDLTEFGDRFDLPYILGTQTQFPQNWRAVNIVDNICSIKGQNAKTGFYTGLGDYWFHDGNMLLDKRMDSCGMARTYWVSGESHGLVPDSSMIRIMRWFDATFTHVAAIPRPSDPGRSAAQSPRVVSLFSVSAMLVNIRGQVIVRRPLVAAGVACVVDGRTGLGVRRVVDLPR